MAVLDSWFSGTGAVALVVRVALTVGLISILGIALTACFRHQAAARHFVLLTALVGACEPGRRRRLAHGTTFTVRPDASCAKQPGRLGTRC